MVKDLSMAVNGRSMVEQWQKTRKVRHTANPSRSDAHTFVIVGAVFPVVRRIKRQHSRRPACSISPARCLYHAVQVGGLTSAARFKPSFDHLMTILPGLFSQFELAQAAPLNLLSTLSAQRVRWRPERGFHTIHLHIHTHNPRYYTH
jgi:hypothetical protein